MLLNHTTAFRRLMVGLVPSAGMKALLTEHTA